MTDESLAKYLQAILMNQRAIMWVMLGKDEVLLDNSHDADFNLLMDRIDKTVSMMKADELMRE